MQHSRSKKRQTVFRFVNKPLDLSEYILREVDRVGLNDRTIAHLTRIAEAEYLSGTIQAIKHVCSLTSLGLKESKDYVEACRAAYPEERQ